MNFVQSKVELWHIVDDPIAHIAGCARVCYASEKSPDDTRFVKSLWNRGHRSMYRHAPVYYKVPKEAYLTSLIAKDGEHLRTHEFYLISTNEQAAREVYDSYYRSYRMNQLEASNDEMFYKFGLIRYTFCIETGIDITRELNRVSPNNIAEQSTRYVDFNKKLGINFKQCHWMYGLSLYKYCLVRIMGHVAEWFYKISRSKYGLNLKPQDARWILPLDTMSKVVYTYSVKQWEHIINLRLFDYTGPAHPDAKVIAKRIKEELEELGYEIKSYKDHE